jgi:hypothetical protein
MSERWAPVPGWETHYQASTRGRIRSAKTGLLRKAYKGDIIFFLGHGRRRRKTSVAQVILETFVGPRPPGHLPLHKNGDWSDDRLDNLSWVPTFEARSAVAKQRLRPVPSPLVEEVRGRVGRGDSVQEVARDLSLSVRAVRRHARGVPRKPAVLFRPGKLSDEQVEELRLRRAAGEELVPLAREFGVSPATVFRVTGRMSRRPA